MREYFICFIFRVKSIFRKVFKLIAQNSSMLKRFFLWIKAEDTERVREKVVFHWVQSAKEDLQRALSVISEISNYASYEIKVEQSTIDWAVRLIARYETVQCPSTPLSLRLALRLGLLVPTFKRRLSWLLFSSVLATILSYLLYRFKWFPFDWFSIGLFSVIFFITACIRTGHKLIANITIITVDPVATAHLFHAHLSQIHSQAESLLQSQRVKKAPQIQAALHAINFQKRLVDNNQRTTIDRKSSEIELVVNKDRPGGYFPMHLEWRKFITEVLKIKEDLYSPPYHYDLGTTEIFVWDIPSVSYNKWEENLQRIEAYLKRNVFLIHRDYDGIGTIGVELAKQPLPVEIYFHNVIDLYAVTETNKVVTVGINSKGSVLWNYNKIPHGIIAGTTGAGKSTVLYSIVLQLQRQNHLPMFIDLKGGASFGFVEDTGYPTAVTKESALVLLSDAVEEVNRREKLLKKWGVSSDISVYNEMTNACLPELFIIFDEFAQFTDKWPGVEEGMSHIKLIAAKGRSTGVHLLISTQRPSQESLGSTDFRSNLSFRCIGRMDSQASSQIALGNTAAFDRLPSTNYAGLFIVRGTDAPVDGLIKVPYIDDIEFRKLFVEHPNPHLSLKKEEDIIRIQKIENYNDIF